MQSAVYIYNVLFLAMYIAAVTACVIAFSNTREPIFIMLQYLFVIYFLHAVFTFLFISNSSLSRMGAYQLWNGIILIIISCTYVVVFCTLLHQKVGLASLIPVFAAAVALLVLNIGGCRDERVMGAVNYVCLICINLQFLLYSRSALRSGREQYPPLDKCVKFGVFLVVTAAMSLVERLAYPIKESLPLGEGYKTFVLSGWSLFDDVFIVAITALTICFSVDAVREHTAKRIQQLVKEELLAFESTKEMYKRDDVQQRLEAFCANSGITNREKEILVLVLDGKSNRAIAQELFISEGTVKIHVHNIYRKLNISRRSDLISSFHRNDG